MVHPVALAATSSHSPARFSVHVSCIISIIPLIATGASQARRNSFRGSSVVCSLRYSHQMMEVNVPYIKKWVHLSTNATLRSSGISGGMNHMERYHISAAQTMEKR